MSAASSPIAPAVALIGYGEVGKIFARDFLAHGARGVAAYDILFEDGTAGAAMIAHARDAGVKAAATPAEATRGADVVVSAVTASAVLDVAREAAGYLVPGQMFLDINSASPATKRQAASLVTATGASYIECAVMAPVPGPGLGVPILAGGPDAARACALLNGCGMNMRAVATDYGRASAMKLSRSIIIKGLEALLIDCASAARAWDVENEVFASLTQSFPSIDFAALAEAMAARVREHGLRRAAEMREAAEMLADLGLDNSLARAVADAQQRGAAARPAHQPQEA
ncbi:MAG: NAD(P)-dependent oxidoreductase [Xanthobacteraceae bacterium]|nr:MAG: NAD(P)-dependent oxidoreductase [Xanthobacteraceae bacterium]